MAAELGPPRPHRPPAELLAPRTTVIGDDRLLHCAVVGPGSVDHRGPGGASAVVGTQLIGETRWTVVATDGRRSTGEGPPSRPGIRELLRSGVAAMAEGDRAALLRFLVESCGGHREELPEATARDLHLARQALRRRHPAAIIDPCAEPAASIEVIAQVDPHTFYVRGWIGCSSDELARVVAVSPEGDEIDLLPRLFRHPRHDVAHFYGKEDDRALLGFATSVELTVPSCLPDGWVLEIEPHTRAPLETSTSEPVISSAARVQTLLLGELTLERPGRTIFRSQHLAPLVDRVLRRTQDAVVIDDVHQLGRAPAEPDVSVIIPLYKRTDFVEHQLAQFVHDPGMGHCDIVYVLDSPELAEPFVADARRLHRLYDVAFRVVVPSRNGGFSRANNLGASVARGRLLLLMNSDVIPDQPGWLERLTGFYDGLDGVGCVGPKLLYEDDSIQHAGMYFERLTATGDWSNEHYYKGFHRTFPPAGTSRPVPAVSAACMMVSAEHYRRYGGLRGSFVQGDFEDSDLCLRMAADGLRHWYAADVELYHLEGQSYPTPERVLNGTFNRWRHTELWDTDITELMRVERAHRRGAGVGG